MKIAPAHRPVVMTGHRGMVVAGHHLAAEAGAQMLREGGNAMDAAIAAAATLAIAVPFMNGIGGDAISLWCDASGRVETINGTGRLPLAFDAQALAEDGHTALPEKGPLTVTVPGVVAAWGEALERYGTRALPDVLAPAIDAAETGVPLDATLTAFFNGPVFAAMCRDYPDLADMFVAPGGCHLGQVLRQPGAAATLRDLANTGWRAFYTGPLADAWLTRARLQGVLLSADDLAAHGTDFCAPLSVTWRGMTLHAAPPNSQGLALAALAGLDGHLSAGTASDGDDPMIDPLAYLVQKRTAFAARDRWCADPARVSLPADLLGLPDCSGWPPTRPVARRYRAGATPPRWWWWTGTATPCPGCSRSSRNSDQASHAPRTASFCRTGPGWKRWTGIRCAARARACARFTRCVPPS